MLTRRRQALVEFEVSSVDHGSCYTKQFSFVAVPIIPVVIPLIVDLADGFDISTDIVIKRASYEGDIAL